MNIWIILTLILSLISPIFYTLSMLKGKVKPHRVTRLVILLASVVGILGILGSDNLSGIIFAGIFFARASYLFIMSLIYGVGGSARLDKTCLAVAIIALGAYFATGNGLLAIALGGYGKYKAQHIT